METAVAETQVAIIGAGPAGLVLSHLLRREGIASVILESRSRAYVQQRVRAGVLEQGTVDLLDELGLSERLHREGLVHHGSLLTLDERRHRIALTELTGGRALTVYGQQEVVKDLIAARLAGGGEIQFEVEDVQLEASGDRAPVRALSPRRRRRTSCAATSSPVATASTASLAPSIPPGVLTVYERHYPFAWLGILAAVAPSTDELIYARHARGFALHSLRSPEVSRLYIQVDRGEEARRLVRRPDLGRAARAAGGRRLHAARRSGASRRASPCTTASSSSRCSTGGSFSPATPRTSCRPPAPRD